MRISDKGISLIKQFEGLRLTAYQDSVGVWTIGYGWTQPVDGKPIRPGMTIKEETAERLLRTGLVGYESDVSKLVKVKLTQVSLMRWSRSPINSVPAGCRLQHYCKSLTLVITPVLLMSFRAGIRLVAKYCPA
ncbi:putative lysozyme [Enterobacter cloacae S611]|uniref:Lysozyme n=1 Tax=Enterobacter cloacae S611 TaxID=1399146 RepID=A0ABN0Q7Q8_ENTCL|nr:putative lysozyme [Enterobacter cloacae S611]